ncbi:hypothetical protein ABKE32_000473 [Escherichia albertii]
MIITIQKAHLLGAMKIRATSNQRKAMTGILFESDGRLIATDGPRMFIGRHEGIARTVLLKISGKPPTTFTRAEIDTDKGLITYFGRQDTRAGVAEVEEMEDTFPEWHRTLAQFTPEKIDTIAFNGDYLTDIFQLAKYFHPHKAVRMEAGRISHSPVCKFHLGDACILQMPLNG